MKKIINIIITLAVTLLAPQIVLAQETTYVSSLGLTSTSSAAVGSDGWLATTFRTGANADGYLLDSVQLAMADATGNPSGFTVMIYAQYDPDQDPGSIAPGNSLGTLNGSANPSTNDIYTYTDDSGLTLSPSTDYFIVLTAGTSVTNGAYEWSVTSTFSPTLSDGWHGDNIFSYSSDGINWNYISGTYSQFAITATPIPEPSPSWLLLFGSGVFIYVLKRNKKHSKQISSG